MSAAAKAKKPQIRIAVVGAGNMGRNHVRTYSKMDGVKLVAVVDVDKRGAELAEQYGVPFISDYRQLFESDSVDAVSIVVPTQLHHRIGMEFIKRGIHTLLEKPIASEVAEAEELIAEAERQGIVFTVGHIERFNPMIQKLKKLVDDKEIGEITSIITRRVGGFPAIEPKTDVIVDLAVHDIDIISHLLGRQPTKIYGHGSKTLHTHKIDSAELLLDYGAASGFVQANWITPVKVRTIAVTGTTGYVEGNYITQELTYYKHNMQKHKNGFSSFVHKFGEPEKYHVSEELQEPLALELHAFIDSIRGESHHKLVKPTEARDALAVVLKAIRDTITEEEKTEGRSVPAAKKPKKESVK
jgi:UDP-N-acetylglucosamine 3-dehydrogenase